MRPTIAALALAALAGCMGVQAPGPRVNYASAALAPVADADGWYTFGATRWRGPIVDGAPDGDGLCLDSRSATSPLACRYVRGNRADEAYVAARRSEIEAARKAELEERRQHEAWAEERADRERAERAETSRAMAQAFTSSMAQLQSNARQLQEIDRRTAQLTAQASQEQADREAQRRAAQQRDREREAAERNEVRKRSEESARVAQAAQTDRERQRKQEQEQQQREREQQQREKAKQEAEHQQVLAQRAAAEKAKREAEQLAEKRAKEKAEREAAAAAQQEAEAKAKRDYLAQLASGARLAARHCPDGKGLHYVVGILPRIKPEKVSCVDVHYEAICPGNAHGSTGVAKSFLGQSTDCFFGDTATIEPTPTCDVKQVHVKLREVRRCGE